MRTLLIAAAFAAASGGLSAAHAAGGFDANCKACHQTAGAGVPGQFPRLSGRIADFARKPDGRKYVIGAVVNGVSGKIDVDGKPVSGVMPAFGRLKDDELAQILNQIVGFGAKGAKPAPFTAAEVAAGRSPRLSAAELRALRQSVGQ